VDDVAVVLLDLFDVGGFDFNAVENVDLVDNVAVAAGFGEVADIFEFEHVEDVFENVQVEVLEVDLEFRAGGLFLLCHGGFFVGRE
jgi:hypothetical protein